MQRRLALAVVLATVGTLLFYGVSLADICPGPPGCVSTSDLADRSVSQAKIKFGAVGRGQIRPNAVNSSKIADGGIATVDLADDAVTSAKVLNGTITGADIADNTVASIDILDNTVTSTDIQNNTILGADIASNTVTSTDLFNEPGLDFNNTSGLESGDSLNLGPSGTWTIAATITLVTPSSGYVTCIGAGACDWDQSTVDGDCLLGWDRSNSTAVAADSYTQVGTDPTGDGDTRLSMTTIRTYTLVGTGTNSFYLKASTTSANNTDFDFQYHGAVCMFFPTLY